MNGTALLVIGSILRLCATPPGWAKKVHCDTDTTQCGSTEPNARGCDKAHSNAPNAPAIAKPNTIRPQKGAVRHSGVCVPSGLLQPPGRSSSNVTSVPMSGQPTNAARAASSHGK